LFFDLINTSLQRGRATQIGGETALAVFTRWMFWKTAEAVANVLRAVLKHGVNETRCSCML